jgi:glycosyltransferase involved in cell wall biosynthesis
VKILFLTPQLPYPPKQGTALRNWGLISGVAQHHDVWLLSFDENRDGSPPAAPPGISGEFAAFPVPPRSTLERLGRLATSTLPDMAWRLWSPQFMTKLTEWVNTENFDIIQVEGIEMARYALELISPQRRKDIEKKKNNSPHLSDSAVKIVFDDHNCEYLLQQRAYEADRANPRRAHAAAYSFVQSRRLMAFERAICQSADAVLCVSPQDAAHISALDPAIHPEVIFNGIDLASYDLPDVPTPAASRGLPVNQAPTLVFTGKMDFRANIDAMLWFGQEVMPLIKKAVPTTRLYIVGQKPHARLDVLRANPNITITGAVDDIRPHIAKAGVYVAPLRVGGGTRFKLLEAMALRKAIVTTSLGCEGFELENGKDALIADAAPEFANAVIRALRDAELRRSLGDAARAFVEATFDWGAIVPKLESIYQKAVFDDGR